MGILALGASTAVSMRAGKAKNPEPQLSSGPSPANQSVLRPAAQKATVNGQSGGQIRPLTQEEAQQLAQGIKELVNQSTEGLKSVKHADGTVSMDLQGRFQNVAVAKKNADGSVTQACVDNPESAAAFFDIDPQLLQDQTKSGPAQTNKGRVPERPKS
jgi:hypothetical protein